MSSLLTFSRVRRMTKGVALAELLQSKYTYDAIKAREEVTRRGKLRRFLEQHKRASEWATCVAALKDAVQHNVMPTEDMICDAITRCGLRGELATAKELYTTFYRQLKRPRSLDVHVAFMGACADAGNFAEADAQLRRLRDRDCARFAADPTHRPVVTDDLTTEYLRAALAASLRTRRGTTTDDVTSAQPPPWQVALTTLSTLRRDTALGAHNKLTPLLLENATQLAELGGEWQMCLRLVQSAERAQGVVPPEAYDAAIRACHRHNQHGHVVTLLERLIATRVAPDERSVRLGLHSVEEVAARERSVTGDAASPQRAALAMKLFEAVQLNGLPLYQQTYEAPLRTCAMSGQWQQALTVLQAMRRDGRPVSVPLYGIVLAARIEACTSYAEVERLLRLPVAMEGRASVNVYLAALRCCMRLRDWVHFERLNREMRRRDIPETYDKIRLLIEAAYLQERYHAVLMRFARFDNITQHERQRVLEGQTVRLHEDDFALSERLIDLVLDAYEKVKGHRDPMVEVAYRAALRHKQGDGAPQLKNKHEPAPHWAYSQAARDAREPAAYK